MKRQRISIKATKLHRKWSEWVNVFQQAWLNVPYFWCILNASQMLLGFGEQKPSLSTSNRTWMKVVLSRGRQLMMGRCSWHFVLQWYHKRQTLFYRRELHIFRAISLNIFLFCCLLGYHYPFICLLFLLCPAHFIVMHKVYSCDVKFTDRRCLIRVNFVSTHSCFGKYVALHHLLKSPDTNKALHCSYIKPSCVFPPKVTFCMWMECEGSSQNTDI